MIDARQTAVPATAAPAYTVTARVLHWLTAVLVLIQIPLGIVIANEWGGAQQEPLYNLHKSIGAVILPLVIVRLINRLIYPPLAAARLTFRRICKSPRTRPTGRSMRC